MSYNTETINVQFLNQSFINKVEQGLVKEAEVASSTFVRQKLREDGFARKIFNPVMVSAAELDRQMTEEPTIIVEKEPDSVAAAIPFVGRTTPRYFSSHRYAVTCNTISSEEFKKSKFELMTARTDIPTILQENSVKDLQAQEDQTLYGGLMNIAGAAGNIVNISGTTSTNYVQQFTTGIQSLLAKKLPIGNILMTQSMYYNLMKQPATQIGSGLAGDLVRGAGGLDGLFGNRFITTIKNDIIPDNQFIVFTTPQYLGQMYLLQDATVFIKTEGDMLSFRTYEAVGIGIGNTNGFMVCNLL